MRTFNTSVRFITCLAVLAAAVEASAQTSPVTYQGRLNASGQPYSGTADFQVKLFGVDNGGSPVGAALDATNVSVFEGLFTIELTIPNVLLNDGEDRWIEIAIRAPAGAGAYTTLSPRQRITQAPYAAHTRGLMVDDGGNLAVAGNGRFDASMQMGANQEISFDDNGQIRSLDDFHRILFRRSENKMELREFGDLVFSPGAVAGDETARVVMAANGNVGIGTSSPTNARVDVRAPSTLNAIYGQTGTASGLNYEGRVGVWGNTNIGAGVAGTSSAPAGLGVFGQASAPNGFGIYGAASANSGTGAGVFGTTNSDGAGVWGQSQTGHGVLGTTSGSDTAGVIGRALASGYGVYGEAHTIDGFGVYGVATATFGTPSGVYGTTNSPDGYAGYFAGKAVVTGAMGIGTNSPSNGKLDVRAPAGAQGIYARVGSEATGIPFGGGVAVWGDSATGNGVLGTTNSNSGTAVTGITAAADNGYGVYGFASSSSGTNYGVYGETNSPAGYAGYFVGKVHVDGMLSKGGGSFKIDHPLDPENKYLYHSFVESPDMKNIYDGVVTTDERGYAIVTLPDWFDALNRDFRYQVTVVDENDSADYLWAKVVKKMKGNQFTLRTNRPNVEVSWQVTGIRKDKFAEANRIPVEEVKQGQERGHYLHAKEYGQPVEKGMDYLRRQSRSQSATSAAASH